MIDPLAWIVLRLPKHLWEEGQKQIEHLSKHVEWKVESGEILIPSTSSNEKHLVKDSNIINIIHHALDKTTAKPPGFKKVEPFLLAENLKKKKSIFSSLALKSRSPLKATKTKHKRALITIAEKDKKNKRKATDPQSRAKYIQSVKGD